MDQEFDLHELYQALAWGRIRYGAINEALAYVSRILEEREGSCDDEYILSLGIAGVLYEGKGEIDLALHYSELCLELAWEKFEKQQDDENAMVLLCSCLAASRLYQKLSRIQEAFHLYMVMYTITTSSLSMAPGYHPFLTLKMLACESIADLYLRQDLPSNAYQFCEAYKACCLALIEADPNDPNIRNKLNMSNILLGDYYLKIDNEAEALLHYQEAASGAASVQSQHLDKNQLEELANSAELRSTLALAYEKLSSIYEKLADIEEASRYSMKNEAILRELIESHPETMVFQYNLASCLQHSGIISYAKQDFQEALSYFEKCYQLTTKLILQVPGMTDMKRLIAIVYQYRAMIYEDMDEPEQAATHYRAMCNTLRDLVCLYPADALMRDNLAYANMRYAMFCSEKYDDLPSALKHIEEGSRLYRQLTEEFPGIVEYSEKMEMATSLLEELKNGHH